MFFELCLLGAQGLNLTLLLTDVSLESVQLGDHLRDFGFFLSGQGFDVSLELARHLINHVGSLLGSSFDLLLLGFLVILGGGLLGLLR